MSQLSSHAQPEVADHAFDPASRAAVYRAIEQRRDMRHFAGGRVEPDVLVRLLRAAHWAPSVGFMQPWRWIRITQPEQRQRLHELVQQERMRTAEALGERGAAFARLKVEGILEAAELWAVVLMPGRERHVFGRRTLPEMDVASAACAIQNLWLAARAEGLGMGWVSIFEPQQVADLLGCPPGSRPLALLCLGPVPSFYDEPMLQRERWAQRLPLREVVFEDRWEQPSTLPLRDDSPTA